jgi:uncharacterized protein (DUF2141 family)
LLLLAFGLSSAQAQAADIELTGGKISHGQGNLMVALYNSADTFRKSAVQQVKLAATQGEMKLQFRGLPSGDYAVALYHDVNANDKLDSNLFGMPKEPYGFSTLKGSVMGPPGWESVKFALPVGGASLVIVLSE